MRNIRSLMCTTVLIIMLTCAASADNSFKGAVITALPENAKLYCGERVLNRGSSVTAEDFCKINCGSGESPCEFDCIAVYNEGIETVTCTAEVLKTAPKARDLSVTTYKNAAVECSFNIDGAFENCRILKNPEKGAVTLTKNGFIYEPYQNRKGGDSFEYAVCGENGEWSESAEVRINIERGGDKIEYADTDGKPYEYAAIRLAEEGIYTGGCLAGKFMFNGENYVNQDEFLAMAAMAGDCDAIENLDFSQPVTRAEAAQVLVKILDSSERNTGLFSWTQI